MKNVYLILGTHPNWQKDLSAFRRFGVPFKVIAANRACYAYLGTLLGVVTYHPEELHCWLFERSVRGGPPPAVVISHIEHPKVTHISEHVAPSGTSALLGAQTALAFGATHVVMAGVDLGDSSYEMYQDGWNSYYPKIEGKVKAMSGWLAQKLGTPEGWI